MKNISIIDFCLLTAGERDQLSTVLCYNCPSLTDCTCHLGANMNHYYLTCFSVAYVVPTTIEALTPDDTSVSYPVSQSALEQSYTGSAWTQPYTFRKSL